MRSRAWPSWATWPWSAAAGAGASAGRSRTGVRRPAGADPALRDIRRRAVAALHDRRRRAPARGLARRTVGCSSGIGFASRPGAVRGATRILLALVLAARAAHAAPSVLVAIGDRSPLGLPFSRFSEVALDDRGRAAFVGASTAVFARTGETLAHLVGAGDVVLGRTVAGVDGPALGGGDCLAFRALFLGGGAASAGRCGGGVGAGAPGGAPGPGG